MSELVRASVSGPPAETGETIVKNPTPHHIREAESNRRNIKDGWYAISLTGQVCSGRFSNRDDCQGHIAQERADIDAYHQGAAHDN
jgi:hypothetical protein